MKTIVKIRNHILGQFWEDYAGEVRLQGWEQVRDQVVMQVGNQVWNQVRNEINEND